MVMPFVFMISATFKSEAFVFANPLRIIPEHIYLKNYEEIFHHPLYMRWYLNTLIAIFLIVVLRFAVVTTAAYAFARLRFRGSRVLFLLILSGMLITPDTTIVSRYLVYKYLALIDTVWAVVIPSAFQVFFLFMLRQFFIGIPKDLTEAAIIDGCSHFQIYYKIILPLTRPALISMVLFTFGIIPPIIIFGITQKYFVQGIAATGIKG